MLNNTAQRVMVESYAKSEDLDCLFTQSNDICLMRGLPHMLTKKIKVRLSKHFNLLI